MKKVIKFLLLFLILLGSFFKFVQAEDILPPIIIEPINIHLTITTKNESLYDQDISVSACNNDNSATSELKITPYCAILQSGLQNDWNWDWAPGAFLNSLGDISGFTTQDNENNDVYHYWSWSLNGGEGMTGLNQYELQPNDLILLEFIDPEPEPEIIEPEPIHSSSGSYLPGRISVSPKVFDLEKAFEFLISQQKENGSFGEELYTNWVTLALVNTNNFQESKNKLVKYYSTNKPTLNLLTDYERYSMALMALGMNPHNPNGENYIEKIISYFDGTQMGDKNEVNDDIFALIVLQNTGYHSGDEIINKIIDFILTKQEINGSWSENVDLTGAGITSLSIFQNEERVKKSLEKAKEFLEEKRNTNGGWGNISSTAWALQGFLSLDEKIDDSTLDYLASNQDTDGGIKDPDQNNRIWQTAYVLTSLSEKNWNEIMQKFEKPTSIINTDTPIMPIKKISNSITPVVKSNNNLASPVKTILDETPQKVPVKSNWFRKLFKLIFNL